MLAGNEPILVHNNNPLSRADDCEVVAAARAAADQASSVRPSGMRPAVAEAIQIQGQRPIAHPSLRGGTPPALNGRVQSVLDRIPAGDCGPGHGRCGLPQYLSDALNSGLDPTGAQAAAVTVRGNPASSGHGVGVPACDSCRKLSDEFGLRWRTRGAEDVG